MPNFKRIGGGEWKPSVDLTWNDPVVSQGQQVLMPEHPAISSLVDLQLVELCYITNRDSTDKR